MWLGLQPFDNINVREITLSLCIHDVCLLFTLSSGFKEACGEERTGKEGENILAFHVYVALLANGPGWNQKLTIFKSTAAGQLELLAWVIKSELVPLSAKPLQLELFSFVFLFFLLLFFNDKVKAVRRVKTSSRAWTLEQKWAHFDHQFLCINAYNASRESLENSHVIFFSC